MAAQRKKRSEKCVRIRSKLHGRNESLEGRFWNSLNYQGPLDHMSLYIQNRGWKALGIPEGKIDFKMIHENKSNWACSSLHTILRQLRPRYEHQQCSQTSLFGIHKMYNEACSSFFRGGLGIKTKKKRQLYTRPYWISTLESHWAENWI